MTINEFKKIATSAKAILYGLDVYKLNFDYNDGESLVIYDNRFEEPTIICYDDIKSITYDNKTKEYTICYYNSTWGENWKMTFNLLTIM